LLISFSCFFVPVIVTNPAFLSIIGIGALYSEVSAFKIFCKLFANPFQKLNSYFESTEFVSVDPLAALDAVKVELPTLVEGI